MSRRSKRWLGGRVRGFSTPSGRAPSDFHRDDDKDNGLYLGSSVTSLSSMYVPSVTLPDFVSSYVLGRLWKRDLSRCILKRRLLRCWLAAELNRSDDRVNTWAR